MSGVFSLPRAGHWLLHSGIQEPSGGVARFYRADIRENNPVSTEITGYAASAFIFLFNVTGDEEYLDRARRTASFLCEHAWNHELQTFPFEHPSPSGRSDHHSYFFDCGIIVRGLLAVWRVTREELFLDIAQAAARGMSIDFHSGRDYHPILVLPRKLPVNRDDRWSRLPGCYQLKAALAWREVAEITGDESLREAYLEMLNAALESHRGFLPGTVNRHRVMDRLHAYCYFLEGLSPMLTLRDCSEAWSQAADAIACWLRKIAPEFVRSDVYAQLLRARLLGATVVPLDLKAAGEEADALVSFQAVSDDPRVDGSFLFGRHAGSLSPHANPVSTAFAIQALEAWRLFQAEEAVSCLTPLI